MSLATNLANLATRIATEFKSVRGLINGGGTSLSALVTTDKSNLVAAINEVSAAVGGAGAKIDDTVTSTLSVWSSAKTYSTVQTAVDNIVASAPGVLDTLKELAAALGDDPNFATTVTNSIALKADKNNPTFTGTVTVPDDSFAISKTVGLQAALDAKITGFADPNADRIVFWDDSAGIYTALGLSGLTISGTTLSPNAASDTASGISERATLAEVSTGTDSVRYVTPQGVRQEILTRAAATHTHASTDITDFATAVPTAVPAASDTVAGKVELATAAEATTGTATNLAVTPAGLKAVADTKAASTHGHALTDSNITGVLPISKVPTGTTSSTVALGNHTHTASSITDFATAVPGAVPSATDTVQGKVELATVTETTTGTDTTRAVTPAGLKAVSDTKSDSGHGHALTDANITGVLPFSKLPTGTTSSSVAVGDHTHTSAGITDFATAVDARVNTLVPSATVTAPGKVELATDAETAAGTDLSRAVTPAGLRSVTGDPETNLVAVFEAALVAA